VAAGAQRVDEVMGYQPTTKPTHLVYWETWGSSWSTFSHSRVFWNIEEATKFAARKENVIVFEIGKELCYTVNYIPCK